MNKSRLLTIFSIALIHLALNPSHSFAYEYQFNEVMDQAIYSETMASCQNARNNYLKIVINKNNLNAFLISTGQYLTMAFGLSSLGEAERRDIIGHSFLSDFTYDRLMTPGYTKALQACFPERDDLQALFTLAMMAADTSGKIPAILNFMALFGTSKLATAKIAQSFPALIPILKWGSSALALYFGLKTLYVEYKKHQLTDQERERIEQFGKQLNESFDQGDEALLLLAEEALNMCREQLAKEQDPNAQKKIKKKIETIEKRAAAMMRLHNATEK